ncbi:Kelch repeat-containing protein [Aliikangiella coralliicola]|uniref:Galactose oxidase n=1 Tax=Aliikangiella coralliicola TaxID=2592383 RepID=A0A545UAB8_9GAMM|nr:kelch repeat-containing protein [Aliikangiella coralliicola]TQV86421.1 galactose oxidase [Aliikangiella coralliicola]
MKNTYRFLMMIFISSLCAQVQSKEVGELPFAISNNAVSAAKVKGNWQLFSFNGLRQQKNWQAVSNVGMGFELSSKQNFKIEPIPFKQGRLASIAVTVKNKIYLFGGYTVAENHEEKSMSDVYQFDPKTQQFSLLTHMPIPVDDTVALVYQDRYIYLVSGWHDVGNIADVQILDTNTKKWFFGTPFPGNPVFGHAAGIIGNQMIVADGVKVDAIVDGRRQYKMSPQSYSGTIAPENFTKIHWRKLPAHPGKAKYRMAASGYPQKELILFTAGSDNPYNYNGIGYNGIPSQPSHDVFAWSVKNNRWQTLPPLSTATMDHRGLLAVDDKLFIVGGMLENQKVSNKIIQYEID